MKLLEYHTKQRLAAFGLAIPEGVIVSSPDDTFTFAEKTEGPVMIKPHVYGCSGTLAQTPQDARQAAEDALTSTTIECQTGEILVEQAVEVAHTLYLNLSSDRVACRPLLMATLGDEVIREHIEPFIGLRAHQLINIAGSSNLPREHWESFKQLMYNLYQCYLQSDALMIELSPLAFTTDKRFMVLGAKMTLDDNARFRQAELARLAYDGYESTAEKIASQAHISLVPLGGEVICAANGAGLAMATMDALAHYGEGQAKPAAFLEFSRRITLDRLIAALEITKHLYGARSLLLNLFGDHITCPQIAAYLLQAYSAVKPDLPVVVRLHGVNEEEGLRILQEANTDLIITRALSGAVEHVIHVMQVT